MGKNKDVVAQAAGSLAEVFLKLRQEVIAHGGDPADILELNTPAAHASLREIAKVIVKMREASGTNIIDLDADPFLPDGWKIEEHVKGGTFAWDASKVRLHLADGQKGSKRIEGNQLHQELKGLPVLNANLLDFLLKPENQHLIPEDWKSKYVFFWGTIYRNSGVGLCVRVLDWDGSRWDWSLSWLGCDWDAGNPAAVLAS